MRSDVFSINPVRRGEPGRGGGALNEVVQERGLEIEPPRPGPGGRRPNVYKTLGC